jgi:hypothetical protein
MIIIVLGSFTLGCDKKPQTGPDSDAYNRDKAYYESFIDAYTYADGSCAKGCEKVNGKCVPRGDTFRGGSYGSDSRVDVIPKSGFLPGQGASIYWKRNIDEIPDAFPQYFEWYHMDSRFSGRNPYTIGASYHEVSTPVTTELRSGYVIPNDYSKTGGPYGIFFFVDRSTEGDSLYTTLPVGDKGIWPIKRQIDGKNLLGFIRGRFSPDFKQMSYYWDYYEYTPGMSISDPNNITFYKRTKRVTLDFH